MEAVCFRKEFTENIENIFQLNSFFLLHLLYIVLLFRHTFYCFFKAFFLSYAFFMRIIGKDLVLNISL